MVILFVLFLILPSLVYASTQDKPDLSSMDLKQVRNITFITPDDEVVYLGFESTYVNPNNKRESVLVLRRFVPMIIIEKLPRSGDATGANVKVAVANNDLIKGKILEELLVKSDIFIYIRWVTMVDPSNGEDVLRGDLEVWMMGQQGNWKYSVQPISRVPFSEANRLNRNKLITVGLRYDILGEDFYQILKIDQADTVAVGTNGDSDEK